MVLLLSLPQVSLAKEEKTDALSLFYHEHEVSIGYAPFCAHTISDKPDYNEHNNHLFVVSVNQFFFMTFRNSDYDRSFAAGYTFRTEKWEPFKNELFLRGNLPVGLVYGYDNRKVEVFGISIMALPTFEVGWKNFSVQTAVVPVFSMMLVWTF